MFDFLPHFVLTLLAFIVALGSLVAIHEYGHYRMAVACGVKVLRFSIGFGKVLFRWRPKPNGTEFVLSLIPLGGYVSMLDERKEAVDPSERHLAFNTQRLRSKALIVAAGPAANLLLAIFLYACINWYGIEEPKAVLSKPAPESIAQSVGITGGEVVLRAAMNEDNLQPIHSFEDLRWLITRAALDGLDVQLEVSNQTQTSNQASSPTRLVHLPLSALQIKDVDPTMFQRIGIGRPWSRPLVGEIKKGGAAEKSGLLENDLVHRVDGAAMVDAQQLRDVIRNAARNEASGAFESQKWEIERNGQFLSLLVTPELKIDEKGVSSPKIEAYIGAAPEMLMVQRGLVDGFWAGVVKTWEVSELSLRMMGRMLIGQASIKNISGPLTIADYAGKSASHGLTTYLMFIAFVSVSLGVMNLLPIPVLDGGHLMYYLWESVTGHAVTQIWEERMQRLGLAMLLCMMFVAFFNDFDRFFAISRFFG